MAVSEFTHLKNKEVDMNDGVMVNSTRMLDGGAKESSVENEGNKTKQYKTANIEKGTLGAKNNLDG